MPTITALEPQKRKGRLNVFVDGQFVIGVGEAVAADLNLRVGREITADKLREVAGAEEVHKALEGALGLLEVRARATREIETRLKQKGYEEGVIAQVIEKLRRLELLDDAQFAAQWVEARSRPGGSRPLGRQRLRTELFGKGVGKEQIAEAFEERLRRGRVGAGAGGGKKKGPTRPRRPRRPARRAAETDGLLAAARLRLGDRQGRHPRGPAGAGRRRGRAGGR